MHEDGFCRKALQNRLCKVLCTRGLTMDAMQFAKLWKEEVNSAISTYRESNQETLVGSLFEDMKLSADQEIVFWKLAETILDDTAYSILLGLDGSAQIGSDQQTYKIYSEDGVLISDCGDLEAAAYEVFFKQRT